MWQSNWPFSSGSAFFSLPAHLMVAYLHAAESGHTQEGSQYVRLASWDALLLCIVHNCACSGCLELVENSAVWPFCKCAAEGCQWVEWLPLCTVSAWARVMTCCDVQAIAHARTGVTVQLRLPVLRDLPSITWGDLLNEGLIQPMFLVCFLPLGHGAFISFQITTLPC